MNDLQAKEYRFCSLKAFALYPIIIIENIWVDIAVGLPPVAELQALLTE